MLHSIEPKEHGPHGQEMAKAVSTCVHCGFCLAACPTYQQLGQEVDSPRGRIVLMKEVLEGSMTVEDALPHVDACLGCLACEPACPSGVPYRDLISPFRAQAEQVRKRSLLNRFQRLLTQQTLPYPQRFRLAAKTGRLAKAFAGLLPASLRVMLDLLPDRLPQQQSWKAFYPAKDQTGESARAKVALLTGCAQSVLDPDINTATIQVLNLCGVDVVIPQQQGCCGALSWHVGNLKQAQIFARQNLDAFPSDVDAIVTNAAGCGSGMDEYPLILKGTADEERAKTFSERVCDVSVLLNRIGELPQVPDSGRKQTIAYHDACHLANAQGVRSQPRSLLSMIPGATVTEVADAHLCCGSAGTYNVDQPEIAHQLGEDKTKKLLATNPDVIATGNIGCMNQLKNHLKNQSSNVPVLHTMQILRDAYLAN
jgi:glycolate oxidase iron-sulfur subunit